MNKLIIRNRDKVLAEKSLSGLHLSTGTTSWSYKTIPEDFIVSTACDIFI